MPCSRSSRNRPRGCCSSSPPPAPRGVLPTIRSRCAGYTIAPVPLEECADVLRRQQPGLTRDAAEDLAFLYEGHIGLAWPPCAAPRPGTPWRWPGSLWAWSTGGTPTWPWPG